MTPFELSEGTIFADDYRVLEPLARGGMGAVYVAEQISTGKRRALKVMHPVLVADEKARARFTQEAKVGALVDSEHVVEVLAAGVDMVSEMPWLVMELLQGETVQARIERAGHVEAGTLREVAVQLRHALGLAHEKGLVHRDLKPENLFLQRPRRAGVPFTLKILDFGIAKLVQQAQGLNASGTQALGSPLWMAPEQANAQPITPATDVWALGLIVFLMVTGRIYWRGAVGELHLTRLMVEILLDPLATASVRAEELGAAVIPGAAFDAWFGRCLSREPSERFQEAGACLDALVQVLEAGDFQIGRASTSPLSTAATALAAAVEPAPRSDAFEPDAFEPVLNEEPKAKAAKPRMGLGQIAAIVAGTLLVTCLFIFSGVIVGVSTFSAEDEAPTAGATVEQTPALTAPFPPTPMVPLGPEPLDDPPPVIPVDVPPVTTLPTATPGKLPSHQRPVASNAAGRTLYDSLVRSCWQAELSRGAHGPTQMRFELELGRTGLRVTNVRVPARWQGTPFAACVVRGLSRVSFTERPRRTGITLHLPGSG